MDVLTSETRWALNNEIVKQVTSSWWSLFIQRQFMLHWEIMAEYSEIVRERTNALCVQKVEFLAVEPVLKMK